MKLKSLVLIFCILMSGFGVSKAETPDKINLTTIRKTPPAPKFTDAERQAELARRRKAVLDAMTDKSVMILFSAEPKIYSNSVNYVFRQENNLYYLTNLKQKNATLVLIKNGANSQEILFLPKRNPVYEAWEGKMYSNEDAARISGLKIIVNGAESQDFLQAVKDKKAFTSKDGAAIPTGENLYLLLPNSVKDANGMREFRGEIEFSKDLSGYKVVNAQPIFAGLRQIKSPYEIKLMQHAVDITTEAQMRAMAMVGRANWEYEVQAEVEYTFRRRNADFWGYPSIVGCGPNATTLHYVESQSEVKPGELLLMDVGAEYDHYTADVTRTFPANGKFSKEQAEIYQIVYDAQEAVGAKTKPGVRFGELSAEANKTIEQGLAKLGLITGVGDFIPGTEQTVPDGKGGTRKVGKPQYSLWFIHGLGHWLGMNVHDVGDYSAPLRAGMIFTNEPGIYIREDALDYLPDTPAAKEFIAKVRPAFEKYKNIGVRIEDDLLVTETGVDWMTKHLPRKTNEIEAFMAQASKELPYTARILEKPESIFFNQNAGILENNFSLFNSFEIPNGKTVRRGFVWSGKNAAYSGLSHAHSHGE